jgi:type II secretory pathway pseudopilin PulG
MCYNDLDMKKRYTAFTLVEMLIVMGIIIILMAIGIASGRFAIQRANKIEHQNAAKQIYQGLQSYYTEHREFPPLYLPDGTPNHPSILLESYDFLDEFIDDFQGGSEASYGYLVDDTGQLALICVTYGGMQDQNMQGLFCTGNAIGGEMKIGGASIDAPKQSEITWEDAVDYNNAAHVFEEACSTWEDSQWTDSDCELFSTPSISD